MTAAQTPETRMTAMPAALMRPTGSSKKASPKPAAKTMAEYWKTAVRSVLALPQERVIASWAPVAVTAMPRRAGALSQVTGVMPPASSRCPPSPQTVPKSVK